MKNGGKREGAGRKPGIPNKATLEIRDIIDSCVDFKEVIGKLNELANGITIQEITKEGINVYTERPDPKASQILLEYRFGKPKQGVEISLPEEYSISLNIERPKKDES